MINSACERIKELESELLEKDIAYKAMMEQRDALANACRYALNWIESDLQPENIGNYDHIISDQSVIDLERILKEHLR